MFQASGWEESHFSQRLAREAAIPILLPLRSREDSDFLVLPYKNLALRFSKDRVRWRLGRGTQWGGGGFDLCFCSVLGKSRELIRRK